MSATQQRIAKQSSKAIACMCSVRKKSRLCRRPKMARGESNVIRIRKVKFSLEPFIQIFRFPGEAHMRLEIAETARMLTIRELSATVQQAVAELSALSNRKVCGPPNVGTVAKLPADSATVSKCPAQGGEAPEE